MNNLWNKVETCRFKWIFSVLLNAAALLILLLLMRPYFETNDDTTLYELTCGAKGPTDSHLIFIHILIGRLLQFFYTVLPQFPWYTLLQYTILFFSFTAIAHVLFTRFSMAFAAIVFCTLYVFFAHQSYIVIQFSRTAGLASCAGILLMFHALEQDCTSRCELLAGILLTLIGGMYRSKEFLLCAAPMSAIGVSFLLHLDWKHPKHLLRPLISCLGSFFLLFSLFFALQYYDAHCYAQDDSWNSYRTFNDLRSNLLDYGLPDYAAWKEEYQKLGISKKDNALFRSCNYADPEVFSEDVINRLTQLSSHRTLNFKFAKDYLKRFPLGFFRLAVFICFLLICCIWLFWGQKGKREIAVLLYEALIIGLLYGFLFYMGRSLIARTETGLWLAASLVVIWLLNPDTNCFSPRIAAAFCAFTLVCNLGTWQSDLHLVQRSDAAKMKEERTFLQTVGSDHSHLYLAKLGTLTTYTAYGPFDPIPAGTTDNLCPLGGWEYKTPVINTVLERFDITNPYRDLINNSQVLVADSDVSATLDYLHTHYDPNVSAYEVKQIRNRHFYSFRSEPLQPDTGNIQPADDSVFFSCETAWESDKLTLSGLFYRTGTNSFSQLVYLRLTDTKTQETQFFPVMTYAGRDRTDLLDGQYGGFLVTVPTDAPETVLLSDESLASGQLRLDFILDTEDGMYLQPLESQN